MLQVGGAQVLDEFYQTLQGVGVSAATGEGIDDFTCALAAGILAPAGKLKEAEQKLNEANKKLKAVETENAALVADLATYGSVDIGRTVTLPDAPTRSCITW